ncbi:hypothetical protein KTE13_18000 [Burkholderia multivorans]|uniref:hypothetical protein n=1 Tax=Burkholderia multivorans TaxID=87883 RepID=UPI001C24DEBF|nr:hypothetical protein [Burkholderia multivorans]MBU9401632.1 hypothetical protein [Burkholderia multivorans]
MKSDVMNNAALGLGVAVIGFALVQYFRKSHGAAATPVVAGANGAAGWQTLTFPLGQATGGVNMNGSIDQVYSSTSWNPDAISALIGQDTLNAMNATGQGTLNTWGFHL